MKLAFFVVVVFGGMIGIVFLYQYLTEKLGLGTQQQKNVTPLPPPNPNEIYKVYRLDYENFGSIVFELLKSIARRYGLRCPYDATGIYSARIADRVRASGNIITFSFEIQREQDYSGLHSPANANSPSAAQIALVFEQDLPEYLVGGYFFVGKITVWDIDAKTIRIEISGVGRQILNYGDLII